MGIDDNLTPIQSSINGMVRVAASDFATASSNQNVTAANPAGASGSINLYIDGIKYNTDDYIDTSIMNFVESMVRMNKMFA